VRVALDTNILAYAEGVNGAPMKSAPFRLRAKLYLR
jgi:predicted nucleic acid-binding protein